jgi:hypothetical protein
MPPRLRKKTRCHRRITARRSLELTRKSPGPSRVQHLTHLPGQRIGNERLLEKSDARLDQTVVEDGVVGVAADVETISRGAGDRARESSDLAEALVGVLTGRARGGFSSSSQRSSPSAP